MLTRSDIPRRVIDPLGGIDQDDIEDIFSSWEVQEKEIDAADVDTFTQILTRIKSLNLVEFREHFQKTNGRFQKPDAMLRPETIRRMQVPPELSNKITKQIVKLMNLKVQVINCRWILRSLLKNVLRKLVEMPMATEDYVLDVGGSSTDNRFQTFQFFYKSERTPDTFPELRISNILSIATNFDGQIYDLNNGDDRRQIKMRLLRMFHPSVTPILEKLAKDYREKFNYPLRVTSLSRSMEYQIS